MVAVLSAMENATNLNRPAAPSTVLNANVSDSEVLAGSSYSTKALDLSPVCSVRVTHDKSASSQIALATTTMFALTP